MPTIFVSGATGYIAQHIVQQFLDHGYKVLGSVRSQAKGDKLVRSFNNSNFSYVIISDIQVEGAFDQALKDHPEVVGFLHTASPFHFNTDSPERDLLLPAIKGTTNVLKAITKYGTNVKKVVITSSYAAMYTIADEMNPNFSRDELSWNTVTWEQAISNANIGYVASKAFAEKAAWEFYHMEKPDFSMTTVNPSFVFGPQLFDEDVKGTLNTSAEIVNAILKLGPNDTVPKESGAFIDVRDVAQAHLKAYENKDTHGQRLMLVNGRFTSQTILEIIAAKFPQLRNKLPQGKPESLAKILKRFCHMNDGKTRELLGFEYVSLEKSTYDTVKQIVDVNK